MENFPPLFLHIFFLLNSSLFWLQLHVHSTFWYCLTGPWNSDNFINITYLFYLFLELLHAVHQSACTQHPHIVWGFFTPQGPSSQRDYSKSRYLRTQEAAGEVENCVLEVAQNHFCHILLLDKPVHVPSSLNEVTFENFESNIHSYIRELKIHSYAYILL